MNDGNMSEKDKARLISEILREKKNSGINSESEAMDFVNKNLNAAQAQKLRDILKDENAAKALLSTPEAQNLFRLFTENEKTE